ncbi:MAG: hypothetical protein M1837_006927 [Sclerophora amabilis]|nr:MAG: hypothetical protein M1837_006927 [Sclerophora amabilis]
MTTTQPIKLAVLDDYLDTARSHFEPLVRSSPDRFELTVFHDTLPSFATEQHAQQELISRLAPFRIICTMRERTPFPAALISALPNLELLLTTGMRNASLDLDAASQHGVAVAGTTSNPSGAGVADPRNLASYPGSDSTVQHAWALILGIARGIARDDAVIKGSSSSSSGGAGGGWQSGLATGLAGKTLGVLGLGRLGTAVAKIGKIAFGMDVVAWSSSLTQERADEAARACGLTAAHQPGHEGSNKTFRAVSKEELFRAADVLTVHYVLSERSRGVVGARELALMKPTSLFVNTSRGPLVDEKALLATLRSGAIKGAALDVYDLEPLPLESEWRTTTWGRDGASEVLLSPHMGYVEKDKMNEWYAQTADNVKRWLEGKALLNRFN